MANPINTNCNIVSTAEQVTIDGQTYEPGYYWALFDQDNNPVMAADDETYHGPYDDPCDAAFAAQDVGYEPGEKMAEGYVNH